LLASYIRGNFSNGALLQKVAKYAGDRICYDYSMKMRLYLTKEQEFLLIGFAGQARLLYNLAVEQQSYFVKGSSFKPPTHVQRCAQLTELRKEYDWLKAGSSLVQQQALCDFDQAMKNFFQNPAHFAPPTKRDYCVRSFRVVGPKASSFERHSLRTGCVDIPKIGKVKVRFPKGIDPLLARDAKSYRVMQDPCGAWYVSFTIPQHTPVFETNDNADRTAVGIDLGVTTTVVTSTGQHYRAPHSSKREKHIEQMQRRRSKLKRGSKQHRRLSRKIAKAQHKGARRRRDWIENTSATLVRENNIIAIEDLHVKNMMRSPKPKLNPDAHLENQPEYLPNGAAAKAGLDKGIARSCWGTLRRRIEEKAARTKQLTSVIAVSARNTSIECSQCHYVDAANRITQSVFHCLYCGFKAHADYNAALNILARGIATLSAPAQGQRAEIAEQRSHSARGTTCVFA
jgi:transposase